MLNHDIRSRGNELAGDHALALERCRAAAARAGETAEASPVFILVAGSSKAARCVIRRLAPSVAVCPTASSNAELVATMAHRLAEQLLRLESAAAEAGEAADVGPAANGTADPRLAALLAQQRRLLEQMLFGCEEVPSNGRWALVEIDLTADYCVYLSLLYPNCRFLFLFDGPYESYRSSLAAWPDDASAQPRTGRPALTAAAFAARWLEIISSFLKYQERLGAPLWSCDTFLAAAPGVLHDRLGITLGDSSQVCEDEAAGPRALTDAERCEIWMRAGPSQGALARHGIMVRPPAFERPREVTLDSGRSSRAKCAVLVPVARYVEPECAFALQELERRGYALRWLHGCAAIDFARSRLATIALDEGFEETIWVDADIAFNPDEIEPRSHSPSVVCGIYPRKGPRGLAARLLPGTPDLTLGEAGGLIEVLYAATGFLLVRREVYTSIRERLSLPICNEHTADRCIPFFMPMVENEGSIYHYLAEDYAFSRRARLAGYNIYADTTIRLWHLGSYRYGFDDAASELPRLRTFRLATDTSPLGRSG